MDWLDSYDMRARITPTAILLSPIFIMFIAIFKIQESIMSLLIGSVFFLIFLYFLSFWVRESGRNLQNEMWESFGGPPSTGILRCHDRHFSEDVKKAIFKKIETRYSVIIPQDELQQSEPVFLKTVEDIFNRVKNDVRLKNPNGLWSIQNAEYGLVRNLYGCRNFFYAFSLIGVIGCTFSWFIYQDNFSILLLIINFIISVCASIFGWFLGPKLVTDYGFEYVESIWSAFLELP